MSDALTQQVNANDKWCLTLMALGIGIRQSNDTVTSGVATEVRRLAGSTSNSQKGGKSPCIPFMICSTGLAGGYSTFHSQEATIMNPGTSQKTAIRRTVAATLVGVALGTMLCSVANAQSTPMQCADPVAQDPTKVYRSGLWKQWIYWAIPGPAAFSAVQRIVAEVNVSRASAGVPLLVAVPGYEIVVSVIDERNARGANGSSALPVTANQEAFLATFVDDTAGGSEVLFLTDPMRTNSILTTAKKVPGVAATVERAIVYEMEDGVDKVETEWHIATATGDKIEFSARYPDTAVYYRGVNPAARIDYANCNLKHVSDIVYRSAPAKTYPLFARDEGNYLDVNQNDVHVKVRVKHHDPDVNAIFNDKANVPEILIAADRDVRIESR